MEKLRQHYRKVEKQDIPASQMAFEKTVAAVGGIRPCSLRAQLLKREEELRRKEQEDTERSAGAAQENDNAVMDSGVLRAVVTGMARLPCLVTGNDLLPSASQPERRIYALGERAGEIPHQNL